MDAFQISLNCTRAAVSAQKPKSYHGRVLCYIQKVVPPTAKWLPLIDSINLKNAWQHPQWLPITFRLKNNPSHGSQGLSRSKPHGPPPAASSPMVPTGHTELHAIPRVPSLAV